MKKFISLFLSLSLLLSSILTGCVFKTSKANSNSLGKNILTGASVEDLKKKYGTENDTTIMPMYNVPYNQEFNFTFNSDLSAVKDAEVVGVYTDIKCLPASDLKLSNWPEVKGGKTLVTVKPSAGFMPLPSKVDNARTGGYWGGAPVYYIKISYDLNSKQVKKLDKPIIVPFTVKSDLPVPNLREEISSDGKLKLVWDKVEGAEKYNVYHAERVTFDATNNPLSGAEQGYLGVMPLLEASVTATEWDDFSGDGKHGLNQVGDVTPYENFGVVGDYYVTSVTGTKESKLSVPVSTSFLSSQLPYKDKDNISFTSYESIKDVPQTTTVQYIGDITATKNIVYDLSTVKINASGYTQLNYSLEGTAITGYIRVMMTGKDIATLQSLKPKDSNNGTIKPTNSTDQIPKPDVPTVIDPGNKSSENAGDILKAVEDNTKKQVTDGDNQKIEVPSVVKDMPVSANSAAEEYLALQLINVNSSIPLKAFPELQNSDALQDALLKIVYQNPMILGVKSYKYNYSTLTLAITYNESADATKKKQQAIVSEAKKIVAANVKTGMSPEEKRKALYDYLNSNTKYDNDALKSAEASGFKEVDPKFDDSFTTYGIMVKKVGVCASYAASYKLLCDLSGVECMVVTGSIDNVPHAWNKVKIDNEWLNVDNTNNLTNSGIAYFCYDTNDATATKLTYVEDKQFCIDSDFPKYVGVSNKNDYYVQQGLEVKDLEAYTAKLTELLKKGDKSIVIRLLAPIKSADLGSASAKVFSAVAKDKLDTAKLGALGTYVIIATK